MISHKIHNTVLVLTGSFLRWQCSSVCAGFEFQERSGEDQSVTWARCGYLGRDSGRSCWDPPLSECEQRLHPVLVCDLAIHTMVRYVTFTNWVSLTSDNNNFVRPLYIVSIQSKAKNTFGMRGSDCSIVFGLLI